MTSVPTDTDGVPWRSPYLYILLAVAIITPMDVPLISPALPALQRVFDLSPTEAGLVITVFALPGILTAPLIGVLADRIGRKPVLIPCLAFYGIAGGGVMITTQYWQVLTLRFVQGIIGGSILASLGLAMVGDLFSGRQQNAVMGVMSAALLTGSAMFPVIGGRLSTIDWRLVFGLYTVSIVISVLGWFVLDESKSTSNHEQLSLDYFRTMASSLDIRQAVVLYGTTLLGGLLTFGAIYTSLTFYLDTALRMSAAQIGMLITTALFFAVIVSSLNGLFARYFSDLVLILIGVNCYGIGLVMVAMATGTQLLLAGLAIAGAGHGFVVPSISSGLARLGGIEFRGWVMSLRTSLVLVSQAIAPPLFTIPAARFGYQPVLFIFGVTVVIVGILGIANTQYDFV